MTHDHRKPSAPGAGPYTFVRGASLLAAASLASRLLGGLARIPLTRLLGGEGMGLFQMAYVVYGLAITFAVSGLCVATSRLVAEGAAHARTSEVNRVLGVSLLLGLFTGTALWLALDRGALYVAATILGDRRAVPALRAIAPAILPVSVMSALKGYFQGLQDMGPTSEAQVVEQTVRVGAMIWLVYALRGAGLERAVGGAAAGNLVGAVAALGLLLAIFARRHFGKRTGGRAETRAGFDRERPARLRLPPPSGGTLSRVLGVALPVTLGAAVLPVMDVMLTFLVPLRLEAGGFDAAEATYLYGQLLGMAYPLAGLPAILASAMAVALIPAITEALERGDDNQVRNRTQTALRLTVLFALPATAGLLVLAGPINQMLFGIPEAGVPLAYVSAACLLTALQQTSSGVLQGLGLVSVPLYGLLGGLAASTVVTYVLTAIPSLGINGAALGIVAGFLVAAAVNLGAVGRTGVKFDPVGMFLRPAAATVPMVLTSSTAYGWVMAAGGGNTPATVTAVLAGILVYLPALVLVGGVAPREVEFIPRLGPRLAALLERLVRW
jgi:stage V sporulation protein B